MAFLCFNDFRAATRLFEVPSPWAALCLLCLSAGISGCGPGNRQVVGDVVVAITFEGEPVTEGSVNLVSLGTANGGTQELDETGVVIMEKLPVGNYSVFIFPPELQAPLPDPANGGFLPAKAPANIPAIFHSELTSPLRVEVVEGVNEYSFDLNQLDAKSGP